MRNPPKRLHLFTSKSFLHVQIIHQSKTTRDSTTTLRSVFRVPCAAPRHWSPILSMLLLLGTLHLACYYSLPGMREPEVSGATNMITTCCLCVCVLWCRVYSTIDIKMTHSAPESNWVELVVVSIVFWTGAPCCVPSHCVAPLLSSLFPFLSSYYPVTSPLHHTNTNTTCWQIFHVTSKKHLKFLERFYFLRKNILYVHNAFMLKRKIV